MPPSSDAKQKPLPENEAQQLQETTAFFERILQSMPEDHVSLEVLSQSYEQSGDHRRAAEILIRLAKLAIRDNDRETAGALAARLKPYAEQADVRDLRATLARLAETPSASVAPSVPDQESPHVQAERILRDPAQRRALVTQELDFAWTMREQNMLSEEQYAMIVGDLTDLSASQTPATISTLHLYNDRQLPNLDRVLSFVAEQGRAPLLPLTSFEPQIEAYTILPLEYLLVKGVLPFEVMANDLLVALLNPLSETLREEVAALTGRVCHFFLAQPADFDQMIERLRKLGEPQASPANKKAP